MILDMVKTIFGSRNVITETAGHFMVGKESQAVRDQLKAQSAMIQYAAEFARPRSSWFDILIDGLNRLPRPFLAFGTIGLVVYAMIDPIGFSGAMVGLAAIPEQLWWIFGIIVTFFFGARQQMKSQQFDIERQKAVVPEVIEAQRIIEDNREEGEATYPSVADNGEVSAIGSVHNAALRDWAAKG